MGFVEKITKEIDSSWSLEEKIRFLYLKSCEVFSGIHQLFSKIGKKK